MGDLSKHFSRREFKCQCSNNCGFDTVDKQLIDYLEAIRTHFGRPVHITSACRCPAHNEAVGGSKNSLHLQGRAADIQVKETDPIEVQYFAQGLVLHGGVGSYKGFTHIDSRGHAARWSQK